MSSFLQDENSSERIAMEKVIYLKIFLIMNRFRRGHIDADMRKIVANLLETL